MQIINWCLHVILVPVYTCLWRLHKWYPIQLGKEKDCFRITVYTCVQRCNACNVVVIPIHAHPGKFPPVRTPVRLPLYIMTRYVSSFSYSCSTHTWIIQMYKHIYASICERKKHTVYDIYECIWIYEFYNNYY